MDWEILILKYLQSLRGDSLNAIFQLITFTGEAALLIGIISVVYWCINKELGLRFGFVMLFSTLGNVFIKNIVKAQRPFEKGIVEGLRKHTATGYSFPSGHTQSTTTFWVMLMIHIKEKWIYYLGSIMIVLVALSRLYLGVHWPVDVLSAIIVGIMITLIGEHIITRMIKAKNRTLFFISILIFSTLILKFDSNYTKAVGSIIGFIVGFMLEKKYIYFSTKGSLGLQFIKIIIGFTGLIVVAGLLKVFMPPLIIFDFLRYMAIVIWVIAGAPYVFRLLLS